MPTDINKRLAQLKTRRRGTDRLGRLSEAAQSAIVAKSFGDEKWQTRAASQPFTRYALGAMEEVGPEYTRISIETAERVGKQLDEKLSAAGWTVEFRLQGSVPLNVHIRGVSDVDLLNLELGFFSYYVAGLKARSGHYTSPSQDKSVDRLLRLRKEAEKILIAAYPAADVDVSGGKAIAISGGSLARPVDVVPSHWVDTIDYQSSNIERDRGVTILNKKVPETIDNLPFLHIGRVHDRDQNEAHGGLKKAIRLCKNVKNDAIEDGKTVNLPSFDIAAIMYHADQAALRTGVFYELAVLAETQRFLDRLWQDKTFARTLSVPDGSRRIFDSESKFGGLLTLSLEMNELARQVAREQNLTLRYQESIPLEDSRKAISGVFVPG
ncbi:lipoprotein [Mesorhizobium sp. WSM1293]|uniref:lipoprotein n=1 Tax=Mesorhizobium sp. WSM1293 TaxID=1040984 RepID=UPI000486D019|nr:lipoprotein [Mesorhizobium sp. WSM1293]